MHSWPSQSYLIIHGLPVSTICATSQSALLDLARCCTFKMSTYEYYSPYVYTFIMLQRIPHAHLFFTFSYIYFSRPVHHLKVAFPPSHGFSRKGSPPGERNCWDKHGPLWTWNTPRKQKMVNVQVTVHCWVNISLWQWQPPPVCPPSTTMQAHDHSFPATSGDWWWNTPHNLHTYDKLCIKPPLGVRIIVLL